MAVPTRCLGDGHQLRHSRCTVITATSKRDFAKHDQRSQRAFGQVVRWGNSQIVQEDQPLVRVVEQSRLQRHRFFMNDKNRFEPGLFRTQPLDLFSLASPMELTSGTLAMKEASSFNEPSDVVKEPKIVAAGFGQLLPISSRSRQMGQTLLFRSGSRSKIATVTIGHQRAHKIVTQNIA